MSSPLFDLAQKVTQNFFTNTALSKINFTITEHRPQGVCVGAITGLRVHTELATQDVKS